MSQFGVAECYKLGVEELGGEGAGEGFYGGGLLRGEGGEELGGAVEFGLADLFGLLLQRLDGWDGVERLEALVVANHLGGDDGFCLGSFPAARGVVGGSDLLEVVEIVDEAALELVDAGVYVAGDGDIDEEDGAAAAA